jgi:dipeptidyl aminopeptidase/acylaminoacyl peptidase
VLNVSDRTPATTTPLAPYGTWPSTFTTAMLTGQSTPLRAPGSDGTDLYWIEGRPAEKGRNTLLRQRGADRDELTPAPFDVRSRAHEYGGGAWAAKGGIVVVSNGTDNLLYVITPDHPEPVAITSDANLRFADIEIDIAHRRVIAVREDHSLPGAGPVNTLVQLSLDGPNDDGGRILVSGTDFVASPALTADGSRLAWLSWNHPNMPWDGTELWSAELAPDGELSEIRLVAGGAAESIVRPRWDTAGALVFVSDRTGWWNLYEDRDGEITPLRPMDAEFAEPQWTFGMSTWDFAPNDDIVCTWTHDGLWHLGRLNRHTGIFSQYNVPFIDIADVHTQPEANAVLFRGDSATAPGGVVRLDLASGDWELLRAASDVQIDPDTVSIARPVSWPAPDGATAHGFYYPPVNPEISAPEGDLPPLIVESHGGPTSARSSAFSLSKQYWTSRGFAILDVNYGGSTGYGRPYRDRLKGRWGIVDVDDCISGAEFLAAQGLADPSRMIIRGGSAGGYTTLAALTFRSAFRVGVSYYGIGDLEALARDTHKFESRYLDGLVGPYPDARDVYVERSPIHHVDQLDSAMVLFQGLEDKVVPPNQATTMAEAVRAKGLPLTHLEFEGEGHGFRSSETIERTVEAELSFYAQVFGFEPADDVPTVPVENLPPRS